jgi:hypothetical protein
MPKHTFDDIRREAFRLLGDAADQLRYPDLPETDKQRNDRLEALRLIGEAKAALDAAARHD